MNVRFRNWLIVGSAILLQFLLEVTLGRQDAAPAILVPVLVFMSISGDEFWAFEGVFWSGLMMDILLHQHPGTSSLAMLLGIQLSGWILRVTTGAVRMTFIVNALLASILSDLVFIFLASRPMGSFPGWRTLAIVPRAVLPLVIYLTLPLLFRKRGGRFLFQ